MHKIIKKSKLVLSFATDFLLGVKFVRFSLLACRWLWTSSLWGFWFGHQHHCCWGYQGEGQHENLHSALGRNPYKAHPLQCIQIWGLYCKKKKKESSDRLKFSFFFFSCHIIHRLIRMKIVAENNYQRSCKNWIFTVLLKVWCLEVTNAQLVWTGSVGSGRPDESRVSGGDLEFWRHWCEILQRLWKWQFAGLWGQIKILKQKRNVCKSETENCEKWFLKFLENLIVDSQFSAFFHSSVQYCKRRHACRSLWILWPVVAEERRDPFQGQLHNRVWRYIWTGFIGQAPNGKINHLCIYC